MAGKNWVLEKFLFFSVLYCFWVLVYKDRGQRIRPRKNTTAEEELEQRRTHHSSCHVVSYKLGYNALDLIQLAESEHN